MGVGGMFGGGKKGEANLQGRQQGETSSTSGLRLRPLLDLPEISLTYLPFHRIGQVLLVRLV